MTVAISTALAWAAFLAFFFYRYARDQDLNFQAGIVFRAWVAEHLTAILGDADAPPQALQYADTLLSLVYDRKRLKGIVGTAGPLRQGAVFPRDALGRYADDIKRAVMYVTILGMLENRVFGNGIRAFLNASPDGPLDAVAHIPGADGASRGPVAEPEWARETIAGFVHSPPGRKLEHAIEEQVLACT